MYNILGVAKILAGEMSRHKSTKNLYKAFLQATSVRYSSIALSEVSPVNLSHDSIIRYLI